MELRDGRAYTVEEAGHLFWNIDPNVTIPSTRQVPAQQGVIPYEEALAVRLELMEERRRHKASFDVRAVSLCEH